MKRFEYKHKTFLNEVTAELNKLGGEGWELIFKDGDRFYFKREIQ
jgi:hypothetical protein